MSTARLRDAGPGDVAAIAGIDAATNLLPWSAAQHAEELDRDDAFVVVAEEPGVVGFAAVRVVADEAELLLIAVAPERQGCGLGGRLLDEVIARAASRGAGVLRLEVRAGNAAALALYTSRGFVPVGRRRGYYRDRGEDAVLLDRALERAGGAEPSA